MRLSTKVLVQLFVERASSIYKQFIAMLKLVFLIACTSAYNAEPPRSLDSTLHAQLL